MEHNSELVLDDPAPVYTLAAMAPKRDKAPAEVEGVYTVIQSLSGKITQRLKEYEAMRKRRSFEAEQARCRNLLELLEYIEQQLDDIDSILSNKTQIGTGVYTAYIGLRNEITAWRKQRNMRRHPDRASVGNFMAHDLWALIERMAEQLGAISPELNQKPVPALPGREGRADRLTFGKPSREGKVVIAGHFAPAVQAALHEIAKKEETTTQKLLAEALNLLFAKRRKPKIAEP
jgi:hypothetical protein